MSTFTNFGLIEPTPGDPAVTNVWGVLLNTNFVLIDTGINGILTLSVAGSSNVVLTYSPGAADQQRNTHFIFTGILTGNINVLFPAGVTRTFTVRNSTTGAFTLSVGANNGSSLPAGTTVTVDQGSSTFLLSDGTDVTNRLTTSGTVTITGGTINNTSIGATSASTGAFTTLSASGTLTTLGAVNGTRGGDVASAATVDVGAIAGDYAHVTGSVTITSFGTAPKAGISRLLYFESNPTITAGSNLILPISGGSLPIYAGTWVRATADTTTKWYISDIEYGTSIPNATLFSMNGLSTNTAVDLNADYLLSYKSSDGTLVKVLPSSVSAMVFIKNVTVSGAAAADITGLTGYSRYYLVFSNLLTSVNGTNLLFRVSTDGGANYSASANYYYAVTFGVGASSPVDSAAAATQARLSPDTNNGIGFMGNMTIIPTSNLLQLVTDINGFNSAGLPLTANGAVTYNGTGTGNAIRFYPLTGTVSLSAALYGLQ